MMKSTGKQIDNFTDNARDFIIAFDFDGTITKTNEYPNFGKVREYSAETIQVIREAGAKVVIWTCRDSEDIQPLCDFLKNNGIECDSINSSIEFAPFPYESRKIYAHMYVDDRGFGWRNTEGIMVDVMHDFLTNIMGMPTDVAWVIRGYIQTDRIECALEKVREWRQIND